MRFTLLLLCCALSLGQAQAFQTAQDTYGRTIYTNPVIPGDFADPSVIKVGNTFYAAGTSSEWAPHFPLFTSTDLVHWEQIGYVFNTKPAWTASSFWAPELFYHNHTFYVYYVARRKSDGISCIGVATSKDPRQGFTDHGVIIDYGKEAIDAHVLDDNGVLYLTFKAYGLDKRPIEILGCRLSADGLKMEGEVFSLLRDDARKGLEGQVLLKKDQYYYLFYSAGGCCGLRCDYNLRVARATSIRGPYENYAGNPLLAENESWKCPGHGTPVQANSAELYYLYHAYSQKDDVYTGRQALLGRVLWDEKTGWPYFAGGKGPSVREAGPAIHNTAAAHTDDIMDSFNTKELPVYWQWDFRHTAPITKLRGGILYLAGKTDTGNHTGTALTVRPLSGHYTCETEVLHDKNSLNGLTLYGDANQSVGISASGNKVQLLEVKDNQRRVLTEAPVKSNTPVRLRMQVKNGYQCQFFYSQGNESWKELRLDGQAFYDGRHLPPWDRSPRPGLVHYGPVAKPAAFAFFSIHYE